MPISELRSYRPALTSTKTFKSFWRENKRLAEEQSLNAHWSDAEPFTDRLKTARLTFDGFLDRSPIEGLFIRDAKADPRSPVLIHFHGYGGNKGRVTDFLGWILLGFSVLAVDVRGQSGASADLASYQPGFVKGHMTKGIEGEATYYYRYVYMDCYRAVNCLLERDDLDPSKVGVMGSSQGGGLSITTASLNSKVAFLISGVPYLCNFQRAVNVATAGPYLEILDYLREHPYQEEDVFRTLTYFDAMNLAPLVTVPALVSVGLIDTICPPSTVFAAYHRISSNKKELAIYPGVAHEDTGFHIERRMEWALKQSGHR
jgi:cephalosporin-C deacetylase